MFWKEPVTCEKPLVAAGVESGSGGNNQGLFGLPAPSLSSCILALLVCWTWFMTSLHIVFYKLNGANLLSNEGEMRRMNFEDRNNSQIPQQ